MMQNIHAHRGLAQISSCLSQNWGEVGRKTLFYSILILSSQRSVASEVVGEVAAAVPVDLYAASMGVVACVGAGVQVYSAGKDMKSYYYPNKEEQSRISNASEQLELATARSKFKNCLITNKLSSDINPSGCPMKCEAAAFILEVCGKESDVVEIIKVFNKMKKGKN